MIRSLVSKKGELMCYLRGDQIYTIEGEQAGYRQGDYIYHNDGRKLWRIIGDGVYDVHGIESVGYLSQPRPDDGAW